MFSKATLAIFSLGMLTCMPFSHAKRIGEVMVTANGVSWVTAIGGAPADVLCKQADGTVMTDASKVWLRNRFAIEWGNWHERTEHSKLVVAVYLVARDGTMVPIRQIWGPPYEKTKIELGYGLHNNKAGEIDGKPFSLEGREDFIGFDIKVWDAEKPRRVAWMVVAATNCTVA